MTDEFFDKPKRILPIYFRKRYAELLRDHPFSDDLIGKKNPYTDQEIQNADDYHLFLREKVYDEFCHEANDIKLKAWQELLIAREKSQSLKRKNDSLSIEVEALNKRLKAAEVQTISVPPCSATAPAKLNKHTRKLHKRYLLFMGIILLMAVIIGASVNNETAASNRQAGYEAGEKEGYTTGFTKGEAAGYSTGKEEGYHSGYAEGKDVGYAAGESAGYEKGYQIGYDAGYEVGEAQQTVRESPHGGEATGTGSTREAPIADGYIGNKKTGKFHLPTCSYLPDQKNQVVFSSRDDAVAAGYKPCGRCNP